MHTGRITGRFAPSPTGPLHFGSIVTALASFLDSRARAGRWLLRIDDLDAGRCQAQAVDQILCDLTALGLEWDGDVYFQSRHIGHYRQALESLRAQGRIYACACSRKDLTGGAYPGTCRDGLPAGRRARSLRLRVPAAVIGFDDRLRGRYRQDLAADCGDFIVKRADGYFAYHLATVIDDANQGVTSILRGGDLLESTPRQVYLRHCLSLVNPEYLHIGLITDASGLKLSKQNHARRVDIRRPGMLLTHALEALGQRPPPECLTATAAEVLEWAIGHWSPASLPSAQTVAITEPACGGR